MPRADSRLQLHLHLPPISKAEHRSRSERSLRRMHSRSSANLGLTVAKTAWRSRCARWAESSELYLCWSGSEIQLKTAGHRRPQYGRSTRCPGSGGLFQQTRRNSRPLFRKSAPPGQRCKPDCRCNHPLAYCLSATGDQSFRNVPSVHLVLAPACFSARLGACQPHRRLHLALKQTCGQRWLPTHANTSKLQKRLRRALAYINFRSVRCPLL